MFLFDTGFSNVFVVVIARSPFSVSPSAVDRFLFFLCKVFELEEPFSDDQTGNLSGHGFSVVYLALNIWWIKLN
jgi:hypothetical protein